MLHLLYKRCSALTVDTFWPFSMLSWRNVEDLAAISPPPLQWRALLLDEPENALLYHWAHLHTEDECSQMAGVSAMKMQ